MSNASRNAKVPESHCEDPRCANRKRRELHSSRVQNTEQCARERRNRIESTNRFSNGEIRGIVKAASKQMDSHEITGAVSKFSRQINIIVLNRSNDPEQPSSSASGNSVCKIIEKNDSSGLSKNAELISVHLQQRGSSSINKNPKYTNIRTEAPNGLTRPYNKNQQQLLYEDADFQQRQTGICRSSSPKLH